MKNYGISLITLIITIIVIIILAAIVIFTGLRTPDSAQFSAFTNDVDTVYLAVVDAYSELKTKHAVADEYRTDEQIYIEVATNTDAGQFARMGTDSIYLAPHSMPLESTKCENILGWIKTDFSEERISQHSSNVSKTDRENLNFSSQEEIEEWDKLLEDIGERLSYNKNALNLKSLPLVRENDDGWYVTHDGKVFNSTGFTYNGKTYFNASYYYDGEDVGTDHVIGRATQISKYVNGDEPGFSVILKKTSEPTFDYTK